MGFRILKRPQVDVQFLLGYPHPLPRIKRKKHSPLKVFKATLFVLAQLDYKAIVQMAMPANLNKKHTRKRSAFAQISFDQNNI